MRQKQKQTGNLKIIKQDADSEKNLEGVSFKIKKKTKTNTYRLKQVMVGKRYYRNSTCR